VQQFRQLVPARRPVSLQRWGVRRIALAAGLAALSLLAGSTVYGMFTPAELPLGEAPMCGTDEVIVLMAQAVPSADAVPCLAALPAGWSVGGVSVTDRRARFWLDSDVAGDRAVEIDLRPPGDCLVDRATEVATQRPGWERFDTVDGRSASGFVRTYLSDGGCVVVDADVNADEVMGTASALDAALSFQSRASLIAEVDRRSGLTLCGVGAPACEGGGR
jgi:hypothetical protein